MRLLRRAPSFAFVFAALLVATSSVTPTGAAGGADASPYRFVQADDHGIDVRVDYTVRPRHVVDKMNADPPYMIDGEIGVRAGPAPTRTAFSLASIGALPPNAHQMIEPDYHDGCLSPGPMDIEPLPGSRYPAFVLTTIVVVKGCTPVAHVFVPVNDASAAYVPLISYDAVRGSSSDAPAARTLRVTNVRSFVFRKPKGASAYARDWHFMVVDGRYGDGRRGAIALVDPSASAIPRPGGIVGLYAAQPYSVFLPKAVVR